MYTRRRFLQTISAGALAVPFGSSLALAGEMAGRGRLPRSTPEAEGVDSASIHAFLDKVAERGNQTHSFMLVRHGKVVSEGWWAPYAPELPHTMYSMSKSFTSTAVGLAISEGKLKLDDKVLSFFPEKAPEKVSENLAAMRVRDLLCMSAGDEKEPTHVVVETEDWVKTFLAQPITHPPGSVFMYNSTATYMLSAIVQRVTGEKVVDYLQPRLWAPLGIEHPSWETCPHGINTGGWGLSLQTESLAKFGQLYLQKGQWQGREIIPAKWVEEATSFKIQQPIPKAKQPNQDWIQGYCYQFWRCRHNAFRGDGAFGQFTVVMPEQDAVAIMTTETGDLQGQLDMVWDLFLPAMHAEPLPANPGSVGKLSERLAALALPVPKAQPTSPVAAQVSGKTFKFEGGAFQSAKFGFEPGSCTVAFRDAQGEYPVTCGLESWHKGEIRLPGTPPRLIGGGAPPAATPCKSATSATWLDDQTLQMTWRYIETPHSDTVSCRFDGPKLTVTFVSSIAGLHPGAKDGRPPLVGALA